MSDRCPKCGAEFWEIGSRGEKWYKCYSWSHLEEGLHIEETKRCLRNQLAQANEKLDKAKEELAAEREKHRWIPVEEELPEETTWCLVEYDGACMTAAFVVDKKHGIKKFVDWNNMSNPNVDLSAVCHWKPITGPGEE